MIAARGTEWLIDAHDCDPETLRSRSVLETLFERLVGELGLHTLGPASWKVFPGEGGITGFLLLSESHLACHSYPEHRFVALNLYSCRPLETWPWTERLTELLGARRVSVRTLTRGEP